MGEAQAGWAIAAIIERTEQERQMRWRYNLVYLILIGVVVLCLTPLTVVHAQIAFVSDRNGNLEIYVMNTDGGKQRRLTHNRHDDYSPSWSPMAAHCLQL